MPKTRLEFMAYVQQEEGLRSIRTLKLKLAPNLGNLPYGASQLSGDSLVDTPVLEYELPKYFMLFSSANEEREESLFLVQLTTNKIVAALRG